MSKFDEIKNDISFLTLDELIELKLQVSTKIDEKTPNKKLSLIEEIEAMSQEDWDRVDEIVAKREKRESIQQLKIAKFIGSLSTSDFDTWVIKFLEWENKYEEFWYNRYIIKSSIIFEHITDIAELQHDSRPTDLNESFLGNAFNWRGYTFKLYQGQGCFWRILKNDEVIFQST